LRVVNVAVRPTLDLIEPHGAHPPLPILGAVVCPIVEHIARGIVGRDLTEATEA
jgi:hypothetical protein